MMSAQTKLSVDTAAEVKNDPSLKTKVRVCLFVCLFVCFKDRLSPLPDERVLHVLIRNQQISFNALETYIKKNFPVSRTFPLQ